MLLAWLPALAARDLHGLCGDWWRRRAKASWRLLLKNVVPPDVLVDPHAFRSPVWTLACSFFFRTQIFFIMLLVVIAGPGLISRDLRLQRPSSLLLSSARAARLLPRQARRHPGAAGGFGGSRAIAVLAYYSSALGFSLDPSVDQGNLDGADREHRLRKLIVALSAGTLMLALSSLTRRSLYVGVAWAGNSGSSAA